MFGLLFKKQYKTILLYVLFFCAIYFLINRNINQFDERHLDEQERYMANFNLNDTETFFQTLEKDSQESSDIVSSIQNFNSYDDFDKEEFAGLLDQLQLLTGNASYATYDMLVWQKNMLAMPGKYTSTIWDDDLMLSHLERELYNQKYLAENIENLIKLSQRGLRRNDQKYSVYEKTLAQLERIETELPITQTYQTRDVINYVTSDYSIYILIIFSIFATFSGAAQSRMSHIILTSKMGMRRFAKMQLTVNVLTALFGFAVYYLLQFVLLGGFQYMEAWSLPVQTLTGYEYVTISFSALEYLLFLLFTKALFAVVVALLSSLLSLACRNNILSALAHFVFCGIWYFVYTGTMENGDFLSTSTKNSAACTLFTGGGNILVTYFPYFNVGNFAFFYGFAYILLLIGLAILLFIITVLCANKLTARQRNYWNLKLLFSTKYSKRQVI